MVNRLVSVCDIEVGMIVLMHGSHSMSGRYLVNDVGVVHEGNGIEWRGTRIGDDEPIECSSVFDNTLWIEESQS